jgi:integrase
MASVRKHPKSAFWYACITLPDGTRRQFSTGLTDKDDALAIAHAAERAFVRSTSHDLRSRLSRLADDYAPAKTADPCAWLLFWVKTREREISPKTANSYRSNLQSIADALRAQGINNFSQLTTPVLTGIRDAMASSYTASSVNLRIDILRIALAAAVDEGLLPTNPAKKVPFLSVGASTRREFRPDEIKALLAHLTGEWRALVILAIYTAQRLNDLAGLQWRNIDLEAKTIRFHAAKTGALVSLPLTQSSMDALTSLPSSDSLDAPVFPGIHKLPVPSRSNHFRLLLSQIGLAEPPAKGKKKTDALRVMSPLCFHSLRHTATTYLKAAGVSDSIARAIVGHESKAISDHYTHLDMETMRKALDQLPTL